VGFIVDSDVEDMFFSLDFSFTPSGMASPILKCFLISNYKLLTLKNHIGG